MQYVEVRGEAVPALGLGTWRLEGEGCVEAVADAIAIGYRHIDTAQMYGNEAEVGAGIARGGVPRDELFVTTKLGMENLAAADVDRSTRQSLEKLGLDYVDLLLIHWPSQTVPMGETLEAMNGLREAGLIRHVGASNFTVAQVEEASTYADVFANQVEYHPLLSQDKLLEQARQMDYMLTAYCPLGRGRLLDKPEIREVAEATGKTPAQVVLRWLIQQPRVSAIPKAASAEHRRGNFDIFDFELDEQQMQRIASLGGTERLINPEWAPVWD